MPLPTSPAVTVFGGVTLGVARERLRLVVLNGVGVNDAAIPVRVNQATQELLCAPDPRTGSTLIPVGCMATYIITALADGYLLLPKELENVYFWALLSGTAFGSSDTPHGYTELINPVTYVDPTLVHDNPLNDWGLGPDPSDPTILRRKMQYQTIPAGTQVLVTGKRKYVPVTSDNDYLIIQNLSALEVMIQAIERRNNTDIDNAQKYKAEAIQILSDEVKNHLMDPNWSMQRKAEYEIDLTTYGETTLGYIRARMVLEVPTLSRVGRVEGARIINQAMREAIDHHNFLGRRERYTFIAGPNKLTFVMAVEPTDVLVYSNFEVLRLLVLAQNAPPDGLQPPTTATPAKEQAYALIERNLAAEVEAQRLAFYRGVPGYPEGSFGKMTSRIGVEIPGYLELSLNQVSDMVFQALVEAIDHHNFLGRTERYSLEDGPNQITNTLAQNDDGLGVMPYANFDVLRLLVLAQRETSSEVPPVADAVPLKKQAFELIERDMDAQAKSTRTAAHLAALGLYPMGSHGWMVARIGLELPVALDYTVNRLSGAVDRAEARLMERGLWKGCIEEFNATVVNGHIYCPARVETMLALDLCGQPTAIRSLFYKYAENGPGNDCGCSGRFEDEGEKYFPNSGERRRVYRAKLDGEGTNINFAAKLRWVPKANEDQMTIRNVEAMRIMTAGILQGSGDEAAESAVKILDRELGEYLQGIRRAVPFLMAGHGFGDIGGII